MSTVTAGRDTPGWGAANCVPVPGTGTHRELSSSSVNSTEVRAVMRKSGTPGYSMETFEHE